MNVFGAGCGGVRVGREAPEARDPIAGPRPAVRIAALMFMRWLRQRTVAIRECLVMSWGWRGVWLIPTWQMCGYPLVAQGGVAIG